MFSNWNWFPCSKSSRPSRSDDVDVSCWIWPFQFGLRNIRSIIFCNRPFQVVPTGSQLRTVSSHRTHPESHKFCWCTSKFNLFKLRDENEIFILKNGSHEYLRIFQMSRIKWGIVCWNFCEKSSKFLLHRF